MCLSSVREHTSVLPVVQCLKTVDLYIVSSFIVVCVGKASPDLVSPSEVEKDIIIIIVNCFQWLMATSTFTFE